MNHVAEEAISFDADRFAACRAVYAFLKGLKRRAHILVAVSGGSDSLGLLAALKAMALQAKRPDIRLSAATVDHRLRPEAAREASVVKHLCRSWRIAHKTLFWDAPHPETGIMEAARQARYALLARHADEIDADMLAVAHTLDDQIETYEMRMARNSLEAEMMAVMAPQTLVMGRLWVVRPFLSVQREDIRTFLNAHSLAWIDDPSNEDTHYERVRVRQSLRLRREQVALSEKVHDQILLREGVSLAAASLFDRACRIHGRSVAEIDVGALREDPQAARYLTNVLVSVMGGKPHGPGGDALRKIRGLVESEEDARMTAGRCFFEKRKNALFLLRENRGLAGISVPPGKTGLWDGRWRVENFSLAPVLVSPAGGRGGVPHALSGLPPRIRRLSASVLPATGGVGDASSVTLSPAFAPFDTFMSGFDLTLANSIVGRFGQMGYRAPPRAYLY